MKKKLLVLAVLAICVAIMAMGTTAYYTSEERARNTIVTGHVDIEIVEKMKKENGSIIDFPEDGVINVLPGVTVSKLVSVKNSGSGIAWIRAEVSTEIVDEKGNIMPSFFGVDNEAVIEFDVKDGWIAGDDGYYYCKKSISPNKSTELLFEEVTINSALGNEYQNCTAKVIVNAYAVQKANNGNSVTEAQGWP